MKFRLPAFVIGWKPRRLSYALAAVSITAALFFHHDLADTMQRFNVMKNLAIAGGFLLPAKHGSAGLSLDRE